MFYKVKNELPAHIHAGVMCDHESVDGDQWVTYQSNGFIDLKNSSATMFKNRLVDGEADELAFFAEPVDEDVINICMACANLDEEYGVLTFYSKVIDTWTHDQYGEISNSLDCNFLETPYCMTFNMCKYKLENQQMFDAWMIGIMTKDGIWYELLKEGISVYSPMTYLLELYCHGLQKFIVPLINAGFKNDVKLLLDPTVLLPDRIDKNVMRIAKELYSVDTGITESTLVLAERLLERHNVNNLCNLFSFLRICEAKINWELFLDVDVQLGEFNDYMVKQVFSSGMLFNWKSFNANNIAIEISTFMQLFRDYSIMMNPEIDPMYPGDLKEAHDMVSNRRKDGGRNIEIEAVFKRVVGGKSYQRLADSFVCGEDLYEFKLPETTEDLLHNGHVMHHCVGGYISHVCSGRSKIVLVYKNEKEYMTIEVNKDNKIVQCKKKSNALPDVGDEVVIKKYASKKRLGILSY